MDFFSKRLRSWSISSFSQNSVMIPTVFNWLKIWDSKRYEAIAYFRGTKKNPLKSQPLTKRNRSNLNLKARLDTLTKNPFVVGVWYVMISAKRKYLKNAIETFPKSTLINAQQCCLSFGIPLNFSNLAVELNGFVPFVVRACAMICFLFFFCKNFDSFQFIWLNRWAFLFLLSFFLFSSLEVSLRFRQFIICMCACAYLELFCCFVQHRLAIGFDFIYFFLLLSRNDMDQLAPRSRHSFVCSFKCWGENI